MRYLLDKIRNIWYPRTTTEYKPQTLITPKGKKVNVGGCILKGDKNRESQKDDRKARYY